MISLVNLCKFFYEFKDASLLEIRGCQNGGCLVPARPSRGWNRLWHINVLVFNNSRTELLVTFVARKPRSFLTQHVLGSKSSPVPAREIGDGEQAVPSVWTVSSEAFGWQPLISSLLQKKAWLCQEMHLLLQQAPRSSSVPMREVQWGCLHCELFSQ